MKDYISKKERLEGLDDSKDLAYVVGGIALLFAIVLICYSLEIGNYE